jgi:flagellar L-ring protein precursor FlgH
MAADVVRFALRAGLLVCLAPVAAFAQSDYDTVYAKYLAAARTTPAPQPRIWMVDLLADQRARRANDLVTVRVIETLSATGSADSNLGKTSNAQVAMPGKAGEMLGKVLPTSSDTQFNGSGTTSRFTELSAVLTARVVEALPNGDLVIEGLRELDVNGDRQVVVLQGVVRSIDIQPGNVVASTRIGQLRIRAVSRGLIRDNLSPGWLIRALNKIF